MCGAPVVMTMLIHAPDAEGAVHTPVEMATGGAAPPSTVIAARRDGLRVTHLYGLPRPTAATFCWQDGWQALPHPSAPASGDRASSHDRGMMVADSATLAPVPRDGVTMGESCSAATR
jgi:fatty-acyl-CoA synthase